MIAHDFAKWDKSENEARMMAFRHRQPMTFDTSSLVITCGKLSEGLEMVEEDIAKLEGFLPEASCHPREMKTHGTDRKRKGIDENAILQNKGLKHLLNRFPFSI